MKRIVHFVDGLNFGGIENVVLTLSKCLVDNGWEVHVISLYSDQIALIPYFPKNVTLHFLPFSKQKKGLFYYLLYFARLCHLLHKISPNIIHAHNSSFSLFYLACGTRISLKKIFTIRTFHFSGFFLQRSNLQEKIRFGIDKYATSIFKPLIVAVSPLLLTSIRNLYLPKKAICIPNGVDTEFLFNPAKVIVKKKELLLDNFSKKIVIYVARMVDGKNHMTLLNAWEIVVRSMPNVCLLLVGDGPLQPILKEEIAKRNLSSSVMFVGAVSNVNEYLSVSDVAVFPSLSEGLSISLLEKMAMCLPAVIAEIPIFTCLFQNAPILFHRPLDYDDLSEKILLLLKDEFLRHSLGIQGRKFVQNNFSIEKMYNQYLSLYDSNLA